MKRKEYIQTQFIKFLIDSEKQQKENDKIEEVKPDEVETDEVQNEDELDADEIIERLIQRKNNISQEYDDLLHGRKRK